MNPTLGICSEVNELLINLIATLQSQGFIVYVLPQNTSQLPLPPNTTLLNSVNNFPPEIKYLLFFQSNAVPNELPAFIDYAKKNKSKLTIVSRLTDQKGNIPASITNDNTLAKKLYIGDIYGGSSLEINSVTKILEKADLGQTLEIPASIEYLYPVYMPDALNLLLRELFSYSHQEKIAIAEKIHINDFLAILKNYDPNLAATRVAGEEGSIDDSSFKFLYKGVSNENISASIRGLTQRLLEEKKVQVVTPDFQNTHQEILETKKLHQPKSTKSKKILFSSLVLVWIIISPFLLLLTGALTTFFSFQRFAKGNTRSANSFLLLSTKATKLSKTGFLIYSNLPFVGPKFNIFVRQSIALEKTIQISTRSLRIYQGLEELLSGVLTEANMDLNAQSQSLQFELSGLYKELSFIEKDLPFLSLLPEKHKDLVQKVFLAKETLFQAEKILKELPSLLGKDTPKNYLVLLQNNMELRPTGGFIGSFATISFSGGKLIDTLVYDVYSADGQLKGYIKPPYPIEAYLNEETWYLRDSNWDPDFAISAKRAEWFLDKTIDRSVDGVIALDLEVVKDLLSETGPLVLSETSEEINAGNLFEKIHYEIENSFFPGSRKKVNLLTSLSRELIDRLKTNQLSSLKLGKIIYENLLSSDIQLYLNNPEVQKISSVLGWSGEINFKSCSGNCHNLWFGINEANLGVNKVNLFINREESLNIQIDQKSIHYSLDLTLKNLANDTGSTPDTSYKSYIRLLTSPQSSVDEIVIIDKGDQTQKDPEQNKTSSYQESGVLINLPASSKKTIRFSWSEPISVNYHESGKLNLFWLKQSGVNSHQAAINLKNPYFSNFSSSKDYTLTKEGSIHYNTDLSQDYTLEINW
ncbi:hypothetical protein A2382_04325 [Candidatus Woesebacteria bacterium RIFOXYB1_FULL_38_16]|uniref:DUF4012 domain-containing protein n=1 Tax=Candidatus Woesebacteria bacterium RIFOXYB1_FULL_38_16 TaxID=1802538 RepID=A0A1F8CTZ2_9BACT|nr:MAG: hypothetical protein A2191_04405 [Candidatus Woesebacteria bacterium RIFOXYA1_FULL_38_9]OGM79797.1 MAG: hypothetical protein A2382_04325 [Candidatus Woesebacteria bacterium RIFOXYB1_FULL_38_16]